MLINLDAIIAIAIVVAFSIPLIIRLILWLKPPKVKDVQPEDPKVGRMIVDKTHRLSKPNPEEKI